MNPGMAIAAYWMATFRGTLSETELAVYREQLRDTELEDAKAVIDELATTGGYPPPPQRIAELAEMRRRERARAEERLSLEPRAHAVLGEPGGSGPYMTFAFWLANVASDEEKAIVKKTSPRVWAKIREAEA